jgi:EAL domain-containing protein (putative c-di-GMP-specific phosphodiesterase class I)
MTRWKIYSSARTSLLKLELTQSLVLENIEETIQKMKAIQRLGVKFYMDDFGTDFHPSLIWLSCHFISLK